MKYNDQIKTINAKIKAQSKTVLDLKNAKRQVLNAYDILLTPDYENTFKTCLTSLNEIINTEIKHLEKLEQEKQRIKNFFALTILIEQNN